MNELLLDGLSLQLHDVISFSRDEHCKVSLAECAKAKIQKAADAVDDFVKQGKIVYGITTGFGAFKDKIIPPDQVQQLQNNILLSHAVGVGPDMDQTSKRAMMLIRANTLAKGHSGIRLTTVQLLLDMLNMGIYPVIPEKGSLGASGDLAPLAHMSLPLIGRGDVIYKSQRMPSLQAFAKTNLSPVVLSAKEGLALTNGTSFMSALAALNIYRATELMLIATASAALTLEVLHGTPRAFDERIHALRPFEGQKQTANQVMKLIAESNLLSVEDPLNVQDAYTLRCIPQVHGAVLDTIDYCKRVIEIELNSVTDNPLIFFDKDDHPEIISGGNFHGEPLAFIMDFLAIALTDLGNMMERRISKLVDESNNHYILPAFLTENGGLNSGFMLLQYTAAALTSENKVLSHPSSTDSISSSANVEDHVSMGANAALHARDVLGNLEYILSIELMAAAQAYDFHHKLNSAYRLGVGTRVVYDLIRERVPFVAHDDLLYPHIESIHELINSVEFVTAIKQVLQ